MFVSPLNECDSYCYGSPGEIEQRAKFDVAMGEMCRAHGTIYAAGDFSMFMMVKYASTAPCCARKWFHRV